MRAAAAAGVLLATLASPPSWGQVQITRDLPQTGENQAQADWHPPLPSVDAPHLTRGVQVGGHVMVGASGGVTESGAQSLGAVLDSGLSLLVPMGLSSSFSLTADALRKPALDGLTQTYKAGTKLTFDAWQAEVGGSFHQQDRNAPNVSSNDAGGDAHAALTLGIIPTLPVSATYSYQRLTQSQSDQFGASSQTTDSGTHQGQLKAAGTLGSVGVDSGAVFSDVTDYSKNMESTVFGGDFGLTVPIAPFLKAYASVAPKYNATSYSQTGNSAATASLESGAGIILPLSEPLSFKIGAGRVDTWSAQTGPSAYTDPSVPPYAVTWKGTAGVDWKQTPGISASGSYSLGKTMSGPLIHAAGASLGYLGGKGDPLKQISAGGDYTVSLDDSGSPVSSQGTWKTSVGFGDKDALALEAGYTGSVSGVTTLSMTHMAHALLSQQIFPELSYALGGDLTASLGADSQPTFTQTYLGKLTLAPRLASRTLTFAADESLALDALTVPALVVSKAGAGVAVPVFPFLSARYRLDWEWDSQTSPGADSGSNFRNALGLTVSGEGLPLSLSSEYALSFGFRGLRHDLTASLTATFWKGFGMQGSLTLSEYDSAGVATVPFLAVLSASYTF